MKIDQNTINNVCVLAPRGRLDAATAPQLRERLGAMGGQDRQMVIDLGQVEFIDSSGLGALVAHVRALRKLDGDLKLAALNDKVRRVFELTRAFRLFDIFDSSSAAAASYRHEDAA